MKLNFSAFRSLSPKCGGPGGTWGTANIHVPFSVPPHEGQKWDTGDKSPASDKLSHLSHQGKTHGGTEIPAVYMGVPPVPLVPSERGNGCDESKIGIPAHAGTPDSRTPEHTIGEDDFDPVDDLWQPFIEWFDARVWLDAKAVALGTPNPKWCAGLSTLHADLCAWMFDRSMVPPTRSEFRLLLEELCFGILVVHGEHLVPNVALKEDVLAMESNGTGEGGIR